MNWLLPRLLAGVLAMLAGGVIGLRDLGSADADAAVRACWWAARPAWRWSRCSTRCAATA